MTFSITSLEVGDKIYRADGNGWETITHFEADDNPGHNTLYFIQTDVCDGYNYNQDGTWYAAPGGDLDIVGLCKEGTVKTSKRVSNLTDKFVVRLPDGLRDQIKELAASNLRSMNSEIIVALMLHLDKGNPTRGK